MYDKKLREEHTSPQWNTQQPGKAPRRNSWDGYPPRSDSEDDDEWKEGIKTAWEAHERGKRKSSENDARERADSQTKQGKKEPDWRNWYGHPPLSEESDDEEDDKWARDAREQRDWTNRQDEAGDRAYTQAKEKEEREWSTEVQARLEIILQLRRKIETMKAKIADMRQEDAEILESEQRRKSRNANRTLIWDHITEKEEIEQAEERAERLQARTATMIKMSWAEKDLEQRESGYRTFLSMQGRQRREQAEKVEAALKANTEYTAQQEAKPKRARDMGIPERLAREKEERRKEAEARHREGEEEYEERGFEREEAKMAKSRQMQKDEAARRQRLLEKIEKQKQETMRQETHSPYSSGSKPNDNGPKPSHPYAPGSVFAANGEDTRARRPPQSRNYQPRTSDWIDREQFYASDSSEDGYCDHGDFWPKIKGGHECSNCARFCNAFIFQCPRCGILACVSCRDQLRRW